MNPLYAPARYLSPVRYLSALLPLVFIACHGPGPANAIAPVLFRSLPPETTGLTFRNTLTETDSLNYFTYPYLFLGGGAGAVDLDKNELPDVVLCGNQSGTRIYRNLGNLRFEDVTRKAGLDTDNRWHTGVTILDVNDDGFDDLYFCVAGPDTGAVRANQLYVSNGEGTFTERAVEYGLADRAHSMQAAPFDYDGDGDLDLFVANYPAVPVSRGPDFYHARMTENKWENSGHLYRNDGPEGFTDVTDAAGLRRFGLTLGVAATDLNDDGHPDLYLSNDFNVPDYFFVNNGDGTFREALAESFPHTSMFGMGVDVADLNSDGREDLLQLDMTPGDYRRARVNMASMRPASFYRGVELGQYYQYMQNAVQLHRGTDAAGTPHFTDVSRLTGMATTDWSWSVLLEDLDNDGRRDAYITNGIKRDVNDNDTRLAWEENAFFADDRRRHYADLPSRPIPNYAFRNLGRLTFRHQPDGWGTDTPGFSHGLVAADFDGDGDLELLLNNMDTPATLLENVADRPGTSVRLHQPGRNARAVGARITAVTGQGERTASVAVSRGYLSAQTGEAHFAWDPAEPITSFRVRWPDGVRESFTIRDYQTHYRLTRGEGLPALPPGNDPVTPLLTATTLPFTHREDAYDDFAAEPLLPHRYSRQGPGMAVGQDHFFAGGAYGQSDTIYRLAAGVLTQATAPATPIDLEKRETTAATFFDADGDGDEDLYVVYGGHLPATWQDDLYENVDGEFRRAARALPPIATCGGSVVPFDLDGDGDQDLIVGGRVIPGNYPRPPRSYVLRNEGGLRFRDATAELAPELARLGMLTALLPFDYDGDGQTDLVAAGEWMGVTFLHNDGGRLTIDAARTGPVGWWYSLAAADLDGDGDEDLVAGNLGLNYKYRADPDHPFEVYAADFDENGRPDIVLAKGGTDERLPLRGRECSSEQVPAIARRFPTYAAFAEADLETIYGERMLEESLSYAATEFAHCWWRNDGAGRFTRAPLPRMTQVSSVNAIHPLDYNGDGFTDVLLAGNLLHAEVETPRADGGYGQVLLGGPEGRLEVVDPGLFLAGEVRQIMEIGPGRFAVGINDAPARLVRLERPPR